MFRRFRTTLTVLIALAIASVLALRLKNKQDDPERGDVPGWVMITMMSAVLVAAILAIAQPALTKDVQRRDCSGSPVMRKSRIASELTAAELSSAEHSVEDSERGDASTEFVMVGALLVLLTMAILQVSFALYARTMLVDAAAAGARYGTMRDRTPQEGMERTRQMIEGVLPSSYAENISYRQSSDSTGVRTLEVTVKSPLPVLGPWGFPDSIEVKGHAIYAEHRSGD